jgi:hypothetical protein
MEDLAVFINEQRYAAHIARHASEIEPECDTLGIAARYLTDAIYKLARRMNDAHGQRFTALARRMEVLRSRRRAVLVRMGG